MFWVRSLLCCISYIWLFCLWFTCCLAPVSRVWVHDAITISAPRCGLLEARNNACRRVYTWMRRIERFSEIKMHMHCLLGVMWMQRLSTFWYIAVVSVFVFRFSFFSRIFVCVFLFCSFQVICVRRHLFCMGPPVLRCRHLSKSKNVSDVHVSFCWQTAIHINTKAPHGSRGWRVHKTEAAVGRRVAQNAASILHLTVACLSHTCPYACCIYIHHCCCTCAFWTVAKPANLE